MPYYHLTTRPAKNQILTNGLLPKVGVRSRQNREMQAAVYLCDETSLPYWRAILRLPILFQVDEHALNNHHAVLDYSLYSEYRAYDPIPPEALTLVNDDTFGQPTKKDRASLYTSYLCSLSDMLVHLFYLCEHRRMGEQEPNFKQTIKELRFAISNTLTILEQFNDADQDPEQIRNLFQQWGDDGITTMFDTYNNTPERIYEHIANYPPSLFPNSKSLRRRIPVFFQTHLKPYLDINTGGWTES